MEISKLHRKTADCTFPSVAHSGFFLSLPLSKPWGQLPLWTTCDATSKLDTERVESSKVKSTRTARISTIPGSIFELASLYGKMPLICQQGQVPRHSSTTRRNYLSGTSRPLRKKLQRYGPHWKQREKLQTPGGGVYSVPKSPERWADRMELLDNNFGNMMRRDVELHGEDYVRRVYPPRASFCIPLLIDPENAYDISVRPTPEMEAAGKPPGTNLADKLLNEPGQPERCCVVLRVAGEEGVTNARARLLHALRARAAAAHSPGLKIDAKARLGDALLKRGYFPESKILLTEVLEAREHTLGADHPDTLLSVNNLANCLQARASWKMQKRSSGELWRPVSTPSVRTILTHCSQSTIWQIASRPGPAERCRSAPQESFGGPWAHPRCGPSWHIALSQQFGKLPPGQGQLKDAEALLRRALEAREHTLGADHPDTLLSVNNLANCLQARASWKMQKRSSGELWRPVSTPSVRTILTHCSQSTIWQIASRPGPAERCRSAPQESFGGPWAHPRCGPSWHIALSQQFGKLPQCQGPAERCRSAPQESFGGPWAHPGCRASSNIALSQQFGKLPPGQGQLKDAEALLRRALEAREHTLGADHPDTLLSVNNLANCLNAGGLLKDAEALFRRALEAREHTLGADHPDTLLSVNNLANCLQARASWKMQKRSSGELWRPVSTPSVRTILTHCSQSTIWQIASMPGACWKMQKRSSGELWRPVSTPSVRTILTHCSQSTIWQIASRPGPAERCRSAPQESFGGPWAHPRCGPSWHIALSQQFGKLPQCQGPAERCRSALQESFGGPWAHPRCGPSWHIALSQQFGKLPQCQGPAERCRSALQESFGGPWAHPRCGPSWHIALSQQFGKLPQCQGPAERCRSALQESFGGRWAHPRRRASSHIGFCQKLCRLLKGQRYLYHFVAASAGHRRQ